MKVNRRPMLGEKDLIDYTPVTSIYTKNSITITRHSGGELDGKINTVEISDGHVKKTLTMVYGGSVLVGFTTTLEKVVP